MVIVLKRIRAKAAMWELSETEMKDILATRMKIIESSGRKVIGGPFGAFNGDRVVITSYPSLEALQKVREETMSHTGLGHGKYFEVEEEILYEIESGS